MVSKNKINVLSTSQIRDGNIKLLITLHLPNETWTYVVVNGLNYTQINTTTFIEIKIYTGTLLHSNDIPTKH